MTKQKAVQLQEAWASNGRSPCTHDVLELLRTENGTYLTGEYACTGCGVVMAKAGVPNITNEE